MSVKNWFWNWFGLSKNVSEAVVLTNESFPVGDHKKEEEAPVGIYVDRFKKDDVISRPSHANIVHLPITKSETYGGGTAHGSVAVSSKDNDGTTVSGGGSTGGTVIVDAVGGGSGGRTAELYSPTQETKSELTETSSDKEDIEAKPLFAKKGLDKVESPTKKVTAVKTVMPNTASSKKGVDTSTPITKNLGPSSAKKSPPMENNYSKIMNKLAAAQEHAKTKPIRLITGAGRGQFIYLRYHPKKFVWMEVVPDNPRKKWKMLSRDEFVSALDVKV